MSIDIIGSHYVPDTVLDTGVIVVNETDNTRRLYLKQITNWKSHCSSETR